MTLPAVRWRSFGLLVVAGLALPACRDGQPPASVTTRSGWLTVGAEELPISPAAQTNGETTYGPKVACNASGQCLVAWVQSDSTDLVLARRFTQAGPADAQVIVLGTAPTTAPASVGLAVGARASGDFLVAWNVGGTEIWFTRVDAGTGAVMDNPPIHYMDSVSGLERILTVDDAYVLVYRSVDGANNGTWRAARITGGTAESAPGISLGAAPVTAPATFAAGPGQIVVGRSTGLLRLSVATGTFLDATPIPFNKYAVGNPPGIAFDGTNYIPIWYFNGRTYALRVRASDGAVLDPPDDFNQLPGAHVIATGSALTAAPTTFFDGTNVLAFWPTASTPSTASNLVVTRVSQAATRVQGAPETTAYEAVVTALTNASTAADVGYRSGFGIVAFTRGTDGVVGAPLQAAAGAMPVAGVVQSVSYGGDTHDLPVVASNGRDFLVAYRSTAKAGALAALVDGSTGAVQGAPVVVDPMTPTTMAAVWTGSVYLVTTMVNGSIRLRAVSCSGQPLGSAPTSLGVTGQVSHAIACNTDRCAIVFADGTSLSSTTSARRVSALDGTLIDTASIPIHVGKTYGPLVAADTEPVPAMRTFLVAFWNGSQIVGRRFRSDLGTVTTATGIVDNLITMGGVSLASDGRQFYVGWIDGASGRVLGTFVDPVSGLPTLATPIDIAPGLALNGLVFDGSSFVQSWYTTTNELRVGRVTPAGTSLDSDGMLVSTVKPSAAAGYVAGIGSAPFGRSLAVFQVEERRSLSDVFHGRFVDDDLGPGLAGRAAACANPTGSGGTGGTPGGGGTSGSGGAMGGTTGGAAATGTGGTASGGSNGGGGAGQPAAGAGGGSTSAKAGGCNCEISDNPSSGLGWIWTTAAAVLLARRLRRSRRLPTAS